MALSAVKYKFLNETVLPPSLSTRVRRRYLRCEKSRLLEVSTGNDAIMALTPSLYVTERVMG